MTRFYYYYLFLGFLIFKLSIVGSVYGQGRCEFKYDSQLKINIYEKVSTLPQFGEEPKELLTYIQKRITMSSDEFETYNQSIVVFFIVDASGDLIRIKFGGNTDGAHSSFEKKLIKILEEMPSWRPGMCEKKIVATNYKIVLKL